MEKSSNSIETDVALLKRDVKQMNDLFEKLDDAIAKIGELANNITRMIAIHEEKHSQHSKVEQELFGLVEKRREEIQEDIKELHSRITTTTRELSDDISELERKVLEAMKDLKTDLASQLAAEKTAKKTVEDRLSDLEKWRWYVMGIAATVGYLLSKFDIFNMITK